MIGRFKHMNISSREGKLIKGTTVYFIGTFISKGLNILILPFILNRLTTSEYGYYDLVLTTISLLIPIFTMQSIEAAFRYLFNTKKDERRNILSNIVIIIFVGAVLFTVLALFLDKFYFSIEYIELIIGYYWSMVTLLLYQRIARSFGMNKVFAISGIIHTTTLAFFSLSTLYIFKLSIEGLLISAIVSLVLTCLYLELKTSATQYISLNYFDKNVVKDVLKFSSPMIPNTISWWATASVNKYIILINLGAEANGLYAVAMKYASVVTLVSQVFTLAWQESAITEFNSEDKEKFYSTVFKKYYMILMLMIIAALPFLKIIYPYIVSTAFMSSWKYIPIALLSTVFTAITSFYGAGYLAGKKTIDALWTTVIASIINILICLIFVKIIGVYAALLGSLFAFGSLWIIRHQSMKNYFKIKFKLTFIIKMIILYIFIMTIYYMSGITVNILVAIIVSIFSSKYIFQEIKGLLTSKL